jgi:hypothetical protein
MISQVIFGKVIFFSLFKCLINKILQYVIFSPDESDNLVRSIFRTNVMSIQDIFSIYSKKLMNMLFLWMNVGLECITAKQYLR